MCWTSLGDQRAMSFRVTLRSSNIASPGSFPTYGQGDCDNELHYQLDHHRISGLDSIHDLQHHIRWWQLELDFRTIYCKMANRF